MDPIASVTAAIADERKSKKRLKSLRYLRYWYVYVNISGL